MSPISNTTIVGGILGALGLGLAYGLCFWRIFRTNRGDKFIECACITGVLFFAGFACYRIPNFPSWIVFSLMMLSGLMSFVSIFFMLQQGYRAIRSRKTRHRSRPTME
jgi:hypothetical protein